MEDFKVEEFRVPMKNVDWLQNKVAKLNKRALKIGAPPIEMNFIREETEEVQAYEKDIYTGGIYILPDRITKVYHVFTIDGEAPIINGWELNSVLEHIDTDDGDQTLIKSVPGKIIPKKYRHTGRYICEHCNKNIWRKKTFVLRHIESDEFKAVGSGCIKDFLGHADPKMFGRWAEYRQQILDEIRVMDEEDYFHRVSKKDYDIIGLETFMAYVAESVSRHGWVSKRMWEERGGGDNWGQDPKCTPTSWNAEDHYFPGIAMDGKPWVDYYGDKQWSPSEESVEKAKAVIKWAEEKLNEENFEDNDYLHNLKVIVKAKYVDRRSYGLAASISPWYWREVEKVKQDEIDAKKTQPSEHVGNIKERLEFTGNVVMIKEISSGSYFYGDPGITYLHKIITDEGNHLTWFASGGANLMEEGQRYKFLGTVKKHDEYNGVNQTIINRCRILDELGEISK